MPLSREIDDKLITEFRSLISGIAWVGVTNPCAQAAASLYQHVLPKPLYEDVLKLNLCLAQLQQEYQPIISGMDFPSTSYGSPRSATLA